jgi:hypothetical protein
MAAPPTALALDVKVIQNIQGVARMTLTPTAPPRCQVLPRGPLSSGGGSGSEDEEGDDDGAAGGLPLAYARL